MKCSGLLNTEGWNTQALVQQIVNIGGMFSVKQDTTELVDFIMETLKNYSIKKVGKKASVSPHILWDLQ